MLQADTVVSIAQFGGYNARVENLGRQFGNYLAKILVQRRWSKAELERRTRIPRLTIDRHLAMTGAPDVGMRGRYADGLKFDDVDAFDEVWAKEPAEPSRYLIELEERAKDRGGRMADSRTPAQRLSALMEQRSTTPAMLAKHGVSETQLAALLSGTPQPAVFVQALFVLLKERTVPEWAGELVEDVDVTPQPGGGAVVGVAGESLKMLEAMAHADGIAPDELLKKLLRDEYARQMAEAVKGKAKGPGKK